jgi:hypothetical protein
MQVADTGSEILTSVKALLEGAIDYAGLFPPAGLSMPEAVINYATYRNSNYSWMLGRFIVPVGRLDEFQENAGDFVSRDAASTWPVSIIAGSDLYQTLRQIEDFNAANAPNIVCDTLEIRAETEALIEKAVELLPPNVTAYFEVGLRENLADIVSMLALTGQRAKIRTGGVTPEAFPATPDIIRFVRCCLGANVPFKATAGLHHPIRCFRPLTYESNSPSGTMHGFLNLFLMTGFALEGYRVSFLEDVMEEEFDEVFRFEDQAAIWREDHTLNIRQIENLRRHGMQSFGSCSFDEPVSELRALGIL